jgi:hypothetical protein
MENNMTILTKDLIANLAITKYAEKIQATDYFQTCVTMGYINYAFTKDCPQQLRNDLTETMEAVEKVIGVCVFYEAIMEVITRNEIFWNK